MKRLALLLAPLLLLLVAFPATAQNGTVYLDETFDASAIDDLFVDLSAEDVIVEALDGSGEARVTITGRGRDADEVFERKRYSAAMQGDRLVVRSDPERRRFNWGNWNASFTDVVRVPVAIDATVDVLMQGGGPVSAPIDVNHLRFARQTPHRISQKTTIKGH